MTLVYIALAIVLFFSGFVASMRMFGLGKGKSKVIRTGEVCAVRLFYKDERGQMTKVGRWKVIWIADNGFSLERIDPDLDKFLEKTDDEYENMLKDLED